VKLQNAAFALACALSITTIGLKSASAKDPVEECMSASENGQKLRQKGKLSEAQTQFQTCADGGCPGVVQRNCNTWLSEVSALLPSVTLSAKNAAGKDLINVTVMLDGKKLLDKLEGKAISMDPGIHVFRFESAGEEAIDERIVLSEGEKARRVAVRFGGTPEPDPVKKTVEPAKTVTLNPPVEAEVQPPGVPALAWVLGGAGLVGIGVGAVLYISGSSSFPDECDRASLFSESGKCLRAPLNDSARSSEISSQAQSSDNQIRVGTWSMIGGGALLTGAVIWIVLDRTAASASRKPARTKALVVEPSFGWKSAALKFSF
jgi:hypothetical protein